ncbi:gamma-cysteine synthetase regulatory subunit [Blumeria hordei DH14]|uniref:GCS light chain n=1 Tax=Blumeria graminis f. sp. hordei (strain DH14) TaxID=546991 RepID=N1JJZ1_BLUG1|nr:gamma-cysteine synthetase regulatory subunit [Blumeria hordei DH14]
MSRLVLSTSNIISSAPCIIRQSGPEKANFELCNSLLTNFRTARSLSPPTASAKRKDCSNTNGFPRFPLQVFEPITRDCASYYVPTVDWAACRLLEKQDQYEITVKLFFLPEANLADGHVLKALNVDSIDLLIVSFSCNEFQELDAESRLVDSTFKSANDEIELETWAELEEFHKRGVVKCLGVADFSGERLASFLTRVRVRPKVNQINAKDCHFVDATLLKLAKREKLELFTHQDCSDMMPRDSLVWLLRNGRGEGEGDILSKINQCLSNELSEVSPKWVVKYTAIIKERGVIENKGYFALASITEKIGRNEENISDSSY